MIDLYKTLRLKKGAKAAAIKRAYRKRAMETHPDRGGSQEEFEEVKLAYEVLADDARRSHYDATGEFTREMPENPQAPVIPILFSAFSDVMAQVMQSGRKPAEEDLVERMRQWVHVKQTELDIRRQNILGPKRVLESLLGRFTTEGEENYLDAMVRGQIAACEENLKNLGRAISQHDAAAKLLKRYSFQREMAKVVPGINLEEAEGLLKTFLFGGS
jgi:curved DNA-binding protein CbpA